MLWEKLKSERGLESVERSNSIFKRFISKGTKEKMTYKQRPKEMRSKVSVKSMKKHFNSGNTKCFGFGEVYISSSWNGKKCPELLWPKQRNRKRANKKMRS